MKKYFGTIKRCNNYYSYQNNETKFFVGNFQIGGITSGYLRDVITIESENTILYEISEGVFITEKDYDNYRKFPNIVDLDRYIMGTYPIGDYSKFVDEQSLEKIKVLSLLKKNKSR